MLLNLQMKINNFSCIPCNRRSQIGLNLCIVLSNFDRLLDLVKIRTFDCRLFRPKKLFCTLQFALFKYTSLASQMNSVISLAFENARETKQMLAERKEKEMKGKALWSYDKMLID